MMLPAVHALKNVWVGSCDVRKRKAPRVKNSVLPRQRLAKSRNPETTRPIVLGYEFSAKKARLLPWQWATDRLKKSRQYWIATLRPDGAPHLMIIWGVWLQDSLWFSTGAMSRKARNLSANRRCVIGTDNAAEAVILEGAVDIIDIHQAAFETFAAAYEKKYRWNVRGMDQRVYRFRSSVGFGLFEKKFDQTATRWTFL
jgi:hypothetical protein